MKGEMSDTSSAPRKKRVALYLDGTWNQVSNTNVWRFRALFSPVSSDGCEQRAYYSTGLGTKFGEKVRGGMFGTGIDEAITSAYEWLIEDYEPGDDIFIFGFSRGAYTARSLSGFVSKCGLLQSGAPLGVNQLFKRYRRSGVKTIRELIAEQSGGGKTDFSFEEGWMLKYAQAVPIKFIAVFDTVGALGVPLPLFHRSAYPFLNTGLRRNNEYAFFAEFMWGWYRLCRLGRPYYRRVGLPPEAEGPGVTTINETIDASVFTRWRADKTYRPPQLSSWAKLKNIDIDKITGSVRTDDPSVVVAD